MKCQRSDIERNVRNDIKRMGTDEIIKQKEKINVNLKSQVWIYYRHIIKQCYHIVYSISLKTSNGRIMLECKM